MNESTIREMDAIKNMVDKAQMEDMLIEVVWSYGNEVKDSPIEQATINALYEWDI